MLKFQYFYTFLPLFFSFYLSAASQQVFLHNINLKENKDSKSFVFTHSQFSHSLTESYDR